MTSEQLTQKDFVILRGWINEVHFRKVSEDRWQWSKPAENGNLHIGTTQDAIEKIKQLKGNGFKVKR